MRKLILIPVLVLIAGFVGCSKNHGDDILSFPELPIMTMADMNASRESVHLTWTFADHAQVTEYRVYVGLYLEGFFGVYDETTLAGETTDQEFFYDDPGLIAINADLCNQIGMCGEAWTYTQFRVTAVVNGIETPASERILPTE